MKLSINDIEILPDLIKKEDPPEEESNLEKVLTELDGFYYVHFLPKGYRPPIEELVKKDIWNGKTGIKEFTLDNIKRMKYVL